MTEIEDTAQAVHDSLRDELFFTLSERKKAKRRDDNREYARLSNRITSLQHRIKQAKGRMKML